MAVEIEGRISIKVFIASKEIPLGYGAGCALKRLHMSCSTRVGVPMLHMHIDDNVDFLQTSKLLYDNALITIVIGPPSGGATTYEFRLNSYKYNSSMVTSGRQLEIDGYINSTKYWQDSAYAGMKGTSSEVISSVASKCGLNYLGDSTSDNQFWYPRNIHYHEWVRRIVERGYKSPTSCMQSGLDLTKTLVYKDISAEDKAKAQVKIAVRAEGFLTAVDVQQVSRPGSSNGLGGFSSSRIEQDLMNPTFTARNKVSVKPDKGSVSMNKEVKSSVTAGKVIFGPIDPGNVHEFYEAALYQNRRITNLYSNCMELLFAEPTGLKLLDVVNINMDNENRSVTAIQGNYRVSSRVVYFNGVDYMEKVEVAAKSYGYSSNDLIGGG